MKEFTSRAKLKDDVVVLSGFGEIMEFDDIRMVDLSHYLHLFQDVRSLYI